MAEPAPTPGDARARRRRRMRLVAIGLSLLLALVLGEVVVRVAAPQVGAFAGTRLYMPDPDTGHRLRPGPHGGGIVINSRGLRDPERPLAKPAGVKRVLVLGDSFAFATTPDPQGFVRVLDELLGPQVEAINSGVPGWSTREQAAWLRRDGLAYEPDAVVVALFVGNDIWDNVDARRYTVVNDELVERESLEGEREQARAKRAAEHGLGDTERGHSTFRKLRNRSHLYRLLKRLPAQVACALTGDSLAARDYHKLERKRLGVCAKGVTTGWEEGWAVTAEKLREVRDLAAPRPVVVLVIPDELQVSAALFQAVCARYALDPAGYDLDRPQARIAELCADLGLEAIDVLPDFRRRADAGEVLYTPYDSHWNAAGNRLAAEALARTRALSALSAQ